MQVDFVEVTYNGDVGELIALPTFMLTNDGTVLIPRADLPSTINDGDTISANDFPRIQGVLSKRYDQDVIDRHVAITQAITLSKGRKLKLADVLATSNNPGVRSLGKALGHVPS